MAGVYWIAEDKLELISEALEVFRNHDLWKDDHKTIYLAFGCKSAKFQSLRDTFQHARLQSPVEFLINLYREHGNYKKPFCDSIFDLKEQLVALQLVMAQLNKEETGEFTVQMKDVLETHQNLMTCKLLMEDNAGAVARLCSAYNKFLSHCNAVDFADVLQRVKTNFIVDSNVKDKFQTSQQVVVVGKPKTQLEEQILALIAGERPIVCFVEREVSRFSLIEKMLSSFLSECKEQQVNQSPGPTRHRSPKGTSSKSPEAAAKEQLLQVLMSYLRLLVNSRDELALSQAINIPYRGLAQKQFTVLRKAAREKNMPMFQTAVSFVLRIRLGGKSYAPSDDNPLLPLTKGLGEFVTFFQKLQTVCEETADAKTAVLRIINMLKVGISKSKGKVFTTECLAEVVQSLQQKVEQLSSESCACNDNQSTMAGMKVYSLIQSILDQNVKQTGLQDYKTREVSCALMTPETGHGKSKLRSLLSQFRTPDCETVVEDITPAEENPRLQSKPEMKAFDSYRKLYGDMSWAKPAVSIKIGPSPLANRDQVILTEADSDVISCYMYESEVNEQHVDGTPKCRSKKRTLKQSVCDKENIPVGETSTVLCAHHEKEASKPPAKRMLLERDVTTLTMKKNSKTKATGKARSNRKQLALLQGQRQLTSFFK